MKKNQRGAFTLVEVLIVVVIMAVLAATIIPQFSDSANDAKVSNAKFNLHTLRSQIQLYKSQHDGLLPSANLSELTSKTNGDGTVAVDGKYGPYVREIPINPYTDSNTVIAATASDKASKVNDTDGWLYDAATGELWINHADLVDE